MNLPSYITDKKPGGTSLARRGLQNLGTGSPPYLSIEGGRFTLYDIAGNAIPIQQLHIDVCIVDINDHVSKIWYGSNYNPNDPQPPRCWSDNGLAPSVSASDPQSATCGSCPKNVWGSKISQMGSRVKECSDQQKIALVVPGMPQHVFLLRVPPNSFINLRAYLARFEGQQVDVNEVLTRVEFEEGMVGTLKFKGVGWLDDATAQHMKTTLQNKTADLMIGRADQPIAMLAAPAQQAQLQTPAAPSQHIPHTGQVQQPYNPVGHIQPGAPYPQEVIPPQPTAEGTTRRRRTRQPAATGPVAGQPAPFRPAPGPETGPGPQPAAQAAPQTQPAPVFGVAQAPPPPNEMQQSIDAIFR